MENSRYIYHSRSTWSGNCGKYHYCLCRAVIRVML